MNLDHLGDCRINLERVQPKRPNSCRLSVAANAINFYHGRTLLTPEAVLEEINGHRAGRDLPPINLDEVAVSDEEIHEFFDRGGYGVNLREISGIRALDWDFLLRLLDSEFVPAASHQLLYSDPSRHALNSLSYIPPELLFRLINDQQFSYQTFLDLQTFIAQLAGDLGHGHMDIVMDLKDHEGTPTLVLANLASYGNEHPVAIPWNLYRHYLAFDWGGGMPVEDISVLPDPELLKSLMDSGYVIRNGIEYFYGCFEIYHPVDRANELDALIKSRGII